MTNHPQPQLVDGAGRNLDEGSYVFYRAGGGRLRFGIITKLVFTEETRTYPQGHTYTCWRLKGKVRSCASSELSKVPRGKTVSIELGRWYVDSRARSTSTAPKATARWLSGYLLTDPELVHLLRNVEN